VGLSDLHIAGSAQYSPDEWQAMMQRFANQPLKVFDLRQESHGLLNQLGISWYGPENAANAGKTQQAVNQDQALRLKDLSRQAVVTVFQIVEKSPAGVVVQAIPSQHLVQAVLSEARFVAQKGYAYQRLYVQDHHAPTDDQVDQFMLAVRDFPPSQWLYFHCRGGRGRTTTFMALYDMLHNAKKVSFHDIMARQVALGGEDLTILPSPDSFKYQPALERLLFLKKFYRYAATNQDQFKTSWRAWLIGESKGCIETKTN